MTILFMFKHFSVIFDVILVQSDDPMLVDFSPLNNKTNLLAFSWKEIQPIMKKVCREVYIFINCIHVFFSRIHKKKCHLCSDIWNQILELWQKQMHNWNFPILLENTFFAVIAWAQSSVNSCKILDILQMFDVNFIFNTSYLILLWTNIILDI